MCNVGEACVLTPFGPQGVAELSAAVYSQATPKLAQGKPMTGPIMLQLLEAAVAALNGGQAINLPTVWSAMVAAELQAAASAARQAYESATAGLDGCTDLQQAEDMHKVCQKTEAATVHVASLLAGCRLQPYSRLCTCHTGYMMALPEC
jgi:hypothetical protein